jgi:glycerophosphoryl diester phosphodiesterase
MSCINKLNIIFIVISLFAIKSNAQSINLYTLNNGGGWYHQSIKPVINSDGKVYEVVDILYKQVGVKGIFSDWPATTTFYANCMGL